MDDRQLRNVWKNKQRPERAVSLSVLLNCILKQRLARRVKQIGQLAQVWDECIPPYILEQSALVSFARGTLTVAMPSAAQRYQLQMLLQSGLEKVIRERFKSGALNRIRLVPGNYECLDFPATSAEA